MDFERVLHTLMNLKAGLGNKLVVVVDEIINYFLTNNMNEFRTVVARWSYGVDLDRVEDAVTIDAWIPPPNDEDLLNRVNGVTGALFNYRFSRVNARRDMSKVKLLIRTNTGDYLQIDAIVYNDLLDTIDIQTSPYEVPKIGVRAVYPVQTCLVPAA